MQRKIKSECMILDRALPSRPLMRSFTMLSKPIILIVVFAERLHTVQSFASPSIRGTRSCRQTKAAATSRCELQLTDTPVETSSPRWHYVPRDLLLGEEVADEAMNVMRGCDAVVATLDMNEGRINPNMMWARTFHDHCTNTLQNIMIEDSSTKEVVEEGQINELNVPTEALEAIQATHRWSSNFVRNLQLCPWAGSSLDTIGAIRYWVLLIDEDNDGLCSNRNDGDSIYARDVHMQTILKSMEDVVRDAGKHLGQITSSRGEYIDPIDPSVAISFIILVDKASNNEDSSPDLSPTPTSLPDFGTFHEYFLDLEDRLLDECDEYWDSVEEDEEDTEAANNEGPLGCKITIAPFHPRWKFGSDGGNDNHATVQAIDYEKRTPYPTISIVKSSAIDALMDERAAQTTTNDNEDGSASAPVTERIADLNEKILEGLGKEKLKELFDAEVVKCPHHGGV